MNEFFKKNYTNIEEWPFADETDISLNLKLQKRRSSRRSVLLEFEEK